MPTIDCPNCDRKLLVTEEQLGRAAQCPRCGSTFSSPSVEEPSVPAATDWEPAAPPVHGLPPPPQPLRPVLLSSSVEPGSSPPLPGGSGRPCPVCGSRDNEGESRCTICGTDLHDARAPRDRGPELPPRRDYEPDRGPTIGLLGTLSVLFGLPGLFAVCASPFAAASAIATGIGIAALMMSHGDLQQMEQNVMDPRGRARTQSGQSQASIGTVLGMIGLVFGLLRLLVWFNDSW